MAYAKDSEDIRGATTTSTSTTYTGPDGTKYNVNTPGSTQGDGKAPNAVITLVPSGAQGSGALTGSTDTGTSQTSPTSTVGDDQAKPEAPESPTDPNPSPPSPRRKTSSTTTTTATEEQTMAPATPNAEPEVGSLEHIDTTPYEQMLEQQIAAAKEQSDNQINYGVDKSVTELERAQEDAQADFEKQRKQVNTDEAKALQNQALYAEARGDRGGIGAAQYAQIQATAATNRRAVNDAQTKLATDTARQISDLRAQGEFKKADAALTLTQSYLGKLMELWQYGTSTNLSIDQFNIELQKWKENFEVQMSELTGVYKGEYTTSFLASTANTLISYGIMPSSEQLAAIGLTEDQVKKIIKKNKSGSGGGSVGGNTTGLSDTTLAGILKTISAAKENDIPLADISAQITDSYGGVWTAAQQETINTRLNEVYG